MMRPIYETDKHLTAEAQVADLLRLIKGMELVKADKMLPYDYDVIENGKVSGYMEVKVRNYTMRQMEANGGFFMSRKKLESLYYISKYEEVAIYIAVMAKSSLFLTMFNKKEDWVFRNSGIGGRKDRLDAMDVENMMYFSADMFTRLK